MKALWPHDTAMRARRELTGEETLAYLAHLEAPINHAQTVANLLQESIDNLPKQGAANGQGTTRRLALTLYTQKAEQLVKVAQSSRAPSNSSLLNEASALLLQAAVQFRKCAARMRSPLLSFI